MARIRGWKSIAHHLGVSQSTVIRWANDPDFPAVRAKRGGTVYASKLELDAWIQRRGQGEETSPAPLPAVATIPAVASPRITLRGHWVRYAAPATLAVAAMGGLAAWYLRPVSANRVLQRADPATRAAYLDARAQWATRTPQGIANATRQFQAIILREPDFAPAFSGLADANVLSSEFAGQDRPKTFAAAEKAARTALALQPDDPAANRIVGFLTYWTTRDINRARPYFDAALASDDRDYLVHLWYGNALIDALKVDEGLARLDRAAELAPDVPAVRVDRAAAQWQAGQTAKALATLSDAEQRYPDLSSPSNYLALFALSRGEAPAYLDHAERWAARIGERAQIDLIARERGAYVARGAAGLWRFMSQQPTIPSSSWHGGHLTIAIAASLAGDRTRLLAVLERADIGSQNWRPLRFPVEAFLRWKNDAEVGAKLDHAFGQSPFDGSAPAAWQGGR